MSIIFYEAPFSSATPVAWALAELEVPHEVVRLDLASGETRQASFLALNPNGKVPTLVVNGTPLFEALAIMMWLGDRFGVEKNLWPAADAPARLEAMSWSAWTYVTFGSHLGRYLAATHESVPVERRSPAQAAFLKKEIANLHGILDARLAKAPFVLGESFSLADLIVAGAVGWGVHVGATFADEHAHAKAWLGRCQSRPSFAKVMRG